MDDRVSDHDVVDAVAVDVSGAVHRLAEEVHAAAPLTVNPLLPLSEARLNIAGKLVRPKIT